MQGTFTAPRLDFMGYAARRRSEAPCAPTCSIDLSGLDFAYKGGRARGRSAHRFPAKEIRPCNGRIEGIDIARLQGDFSGQADLEISGRGEFLKDPLEISYRLAAKSVFTMTADSASTAGPAMLTDFSDFSAEQQRRTAEPGRRHPRSRWRSAARMPL